MGVAADHVGWFQNGAGYRIVDTAAFLRNLARRSMDNFFLCVIHQDHGLGDALAYHGATGNGTVGIKHFYPVVIDNSGFLGIDFGNPHMRATAEQGKHTQVF